MSVHGGPVRGADATAAPHRRRRRRRRPSTAPDSALHPHAQAHHRVLCSGNLMFVCLLDPPLFSGVQIHRVGQCDLQQRHHDSVHVQSVCDGNAGVCGHLGRRRCPLRHPSDIMFAKLFAGGGVHARRSVYRECRLPVCRAVPVRADRVAGAAAGRPAERVRVRLAVVRVRPAGAAAGGTDDGAQSAAGRLQCVQLFLVQPGDVPGGE